MSTSEKTIMDAINQSLANFGSPSKLLIDPNLLKSYLKLMQGEFADTVYCDYNLTKSMQIFARFNVLLTKLGFVEPNEQVELREVSCCFAKSINRNKQKC